MKLHLRFKYNANEKGAREAYDKVSKVYEKVDRLLEKSKKQFIHSEQFTAADLTFACHSAPILLASQVNFLYFLFLNKNKIDFLPFFFFNIKKIGRYWLSFSNVHSINERGTCMGLSKSSRAKTNPFCSFSN